ncbi:DJ-1/PfpI family protein [Viridibacillus sp. FSL R5-0477]|uniref:Transcriptional regulator containing an amidase domain and an AraC-type DNA-binding HTH domain n=1 Tax=Viridibacillus arenosi FSL R5-213 TaxID=1227360 RepID=W4ENS9_9BACL|nr:MULTISPECIES: DJ-1/PfpI family protein [Viridibacillus]ETT81441.1 transcriptional regulator containing an amidase domain and an AraC-type DNA-binding HTH domain [Viridibacillus arenosi FSL R5-213]OMC80078.1 glutamine amidotransferase [Viridibacillus sp. FSL H8-0123]OMC84358.1 glutamine amidotransferase [Viridibacillus sp. FSL H7-0596]OMC89642.1 glutamine amidotransferase [Viridibacillus arenosi]
MNQTEKKEILIVVLDEFADWELSYIAAFLNTTDKYITKIVSVSEGVIKSIGGLSVLPNYTFRSIPEVFYGLILIGGNSWRKSLNNNVIPIMEKALTMDIPVGAICDATVFMGANGWLNEIKHTSNDLNDLKTYAKDNYQNEKNYVLEQAVSDGKIVTANGTASLEFAKEILELLEAYPKEHINQLYNFHKLGYYEAKKVNS